ncbi:MAG TPA: PP2C family serine/threonine-protein phosphatase [Streptosporangiaceae bacterium]
MTLALHYALRSDVGLLREGNEDSAYAGPNLLVIADGMGGHAAGEVASAVAISAISPLDHAGLHDEQDMLRALASAVSEASITLHEMSVADPSVEGMGTTLTALLWSGATVALCHIGDSRAYMLRDGEFGQISRDHTLVQSLVDEGRLTPEAAATHPQRSLVMRALQSGSEPDPDLEIRQGRLGDRYLICSDGLSDVVTDQTLHKTLASVPDPDQAVLHLIDLAIRAGGPDNITCVVADVVDTVTGPVAPSTETVLAGAAASGEGRPQPRGDSPAGRAHLLTQEPPPPAPSARASSASTNGYHYADDDYGSDELADGGRRRWPIVTSILVVLLLVIAGGGYFAWRVTQSQYYVGSDGKQVIIYRGVDQSVAGLHLSSTYQRTEVPVSDVQGSVLVLPTSAGTLTEAHRIVQNIQRGYLCRKASAELAHWTANKPKAPVIAKRHKPTRKQKQELAKVKAYPPKPTAPAYCTTQGSG